MRERDEEIGERDTHMETAQDGGRETDRVRDHAIDEGHTETEEALGNETVIVLEVVQEGEADNGEEEDANTQRGRKRQRNIDNWKKNKRKRLRNSGQSYMNSHGIQVPRRRMREKNCASCRYKCNENFPEEKDACKYCEWYQRLEDSEKTNHKNEYDAHQLRKTQAREQKENDKKKAKENESYKTVTFDLEQVLTTPWSNVSSLFYSRKLNSKDVKCYMWHEGEGGRGSSEISTCVCKRNRLVSDTCGATLFDAAALYTRIPAVLYVRILSGNNISHQHVRSISPSCVTPALQLSSL
ncbi:unnamed protein product [Leuciscus chuanchicus]